MRDHAWLQQLLDETWDKYFSDVSQDNIVRVEFGRKAKTRLGSIKMSAKDSEVTIITMNGLFKDSAIPEYVILATLVHELCHYAHGFHSPIRKKFDFPHAGGVMRREFRERGLEKLYLDQKQWLKTNWRETVTKSGLLRKSQAYALKKVVKRTTKIPKPFWF